ncbi:MAG: maltose alpha-D-glucosyltransferase [Candidatus Dormibacteraceae bacterium]
MTASPDPPPGRAPLVIARRPPRAEPVPEPNPIWYKDAVIYELHVRSFFDSNADGVGDFPGLIEKLDYLQDLGVTALWLLPFYVSPLKDDGYDIADYAEVNPAYGRAGDVRRLIREAHRRGMRVIIELVCNHTSDEHPWFQRARRARPSSVWRDFYVWSQTKDRYTQARVIFKDFEQSNWTWDNVAGAYFWHRFYAHQPDLNYDSPHVRSAIFRVVDHWLEMGVDGLRLDAIPYLYEREGTNCENLPETHDFLKQLRRHVDERYPDRMLLGEANQWPEDAVSYFGAGDECHMAFHFPLMPRLFMSIRMEDRFPIVDILAQTPNIPETAQWALFLRNHDELTLEMVTDEERDYMYRVYTRDPEARINLGIRRRLAPLLGNNRRRIELMMGLLFALPGTPVIYSGDEIGMGDNIYLGDRNGVRTPMQWSADRNAGFSRANRQRLYLPVIIDPEYHYEAVNVEAQQGNPSSLLSWMKRLIALRKRYQAFGRGTLEFLHPDNRKVLAFLRRHEEEQVLVVANLSRFTQAVELDLAALNGFQPIEMYGGTEFPAIGELPYFITLGPHDFYWFMLQRPRASVPSGSAVEAGLPRLTVRGGWKDLVGGSERGRLAEVLPEYLQGRRWFGGKARRLRGVTIIDAVPFPAPGDRAHLLILEVDYAEGDAQRYVLPVAFADENRAHALRERVPHAAIAWVEAGGDSGMLYDPLWEAAFGDRLLEAISRRQRFRGGAGIVVAGHTRAFRGLRGSSETLLQPSVSNAEQTNNSVVFGERLMLKVYRRVEEGVNPELEIGRFLTERAAFTRMAPLAGSLEYRRPHWEPITLALLQGYVPNQGDAWGYTLEVLDGYFERVLQAPSEEVDTDYVEPARLLGRRTAELHVALASGDSDPAFAPEPTTMLDQRSIYQSMRRLGVDGIQLLRNRLALLPEAARPLAHELIDLEPEIQSRLRRLLERPITSLRIRCHGDYHLGQVLFTGSDFVIIDFEGEPARPLRERRLKRWALKDVAGMLRSFRYAAFSALESRPEASREALRGWARRWADVVCGEFLAAYMESCGSAGFQPRSPEEVRLLLDSHLLEKALYELGYELNNRPDWVTIPLEGLLELLRPQREPL